MTPEEKIQAAAKAMYPGLWEVQDEHALPAEARAHLAQHRGTALALAGTALSAAGALGSDEPGQLAGEVYHFAVNTPGGSMPLEGVAIVSYLDREGTRRFTVNHFGEVPVTLVGLLEVAKQSIIRAVVGDDDEEDEDDTGA